MLSIGKEWFTITRNKWWTRTKGRIRSQGKIKSDVSDLREWTS